jgi:hypothetical protein
MHIHRLVVFAVIVTAACTEPSHPSDLSGSRTLREQLSKSGRFSVDVADSGGIITAARKLAGQWDAGSVALAIAAGEIVVSDTGQVTSDMRDSPTQDTHAPDMLAPDMLAPVVLAPDTLALETLDVILAPIAIPRGVLGASTAELRDIRVRLTTGQAFAATWASDDAVSGAAELAIELQWTLVLDGTPIPLGSPRLPPIPMSIALARDGDAAIAELHLAVPGALWAWAGVIELRGLGLALVATSRS